MPKISEARRDARRTEILDAATRCFLRTGYQRTSMAEIIAESGLSAGAIYGYFASKQELLRSVAERMLADRRAELEAASAEHIPSPAQIVRILVSGVRANVPIVVLVQVWGEATVDPELRTLVQAVLTRMRSTIHGALAAWAREDPARVTGDPDAWAAAATPVLMGLIPGFVLQQSLVDGFDADAYLAAVGTLLPDS